ncbi:MAG TPA: transglutaminase domain-containing protein [Candidatus Limnocylindrales bacterium]|nr:transglutaminase domain-containing protein [Candidatus Limnocylindrales bacterium]
MKRFGILILLLGIAALLAMSLPILHAKQADESNVPARSLRFEYVVHVPALPAGAHELRLWIPLPYEDLYQLVSQVHIASPVAYEIRRESEYNDRYAYLAVDAAQAKAPFDVQVTFHVTRLEHRVALDSTRDIPSQPIVPPARFLKPDRLVPIDGQIAELSQEQTKWVTLPLDKARKIYDYVIATMHYDHDGNQWGRGDAIWACDSHHGNCTDFHSLFIGMARAAGIPARFEIGFPLPANAHEGAIASYHCWAEFYIDGIGWIPIDASEAWKNKSKINYFFGATDQNRVMFSLGRDIRFNPPQNAGPVNYFVYPYAEVDGKPFADVKSDISFRDDGGAAVASAAGNSR